MENLKELDNNELNEINGGVVWYAALSLGVAASVASHVIIEAYNDWEAHAQAFKSGRKAA